MELTRMVLSAAKMGAFEPTKKNDIATIMISVFDLLINSQSQTVDDQEVTGKKIFEGFEWCSKLPAEEFRVETMNLYLELLIGMGGGGE